MGYMKIFLLKIAENEINSNYNKRVYNIFLLNFFAVHFEVRLKMNKYAKNT